MGGLGVCARTCVWRDWGGGDSEAKQRGQRRPLTAEKLRQGSPLGVAGQGGAVETGAVPSARAWVTGARAFKYIFL